MDAIEQNDRNCRTNGIEDGSTLHTVLHFGDQFHIHGDNPEYHYDYLQRFGRQSRQCCEQKTSKNDKETEKEH